jgi:hypothetical protein
MLESIWTKKSDLCGGKNNEILISSIPTPRHGIVRVLRFLKMKSKLECTAAAAAAAYLRCAIFILLSRE